MFIRIFGNVIFVFGGLGVAGSDLNALQGVIKF
jgi:hypothetical protein